MAHIECLKNNHNITLLSKTKTYQVLYLNYMYIYKASSGPLNELIDAYIIVYSVYVSHIFYVL